MIFANVRIAICFLVHLCILLIKFGNRNKLFFEKVKGIYIYGIERKRKDN